MMTLNDLIRRLRAAKNISAVARDAGVNRATAVRIRDRKHAPNMGTFERLVRAVSGK